MATLKHLTNKDFDLNIQNAGTPVLVDFYADWCGPCKALAPTLEAVAEEQAANLAVVKVDIDENPDLATRFNIQSIPTLIIFEGGEAKKTLKGLLPKRALLDELAPFLAKAAVVVS
ncbi:MAG: thioredoxin [Candidatus Hydrogenedentes bacterium]|nr:thioredoxin [Candidatus Hydrogenedentota bacterium]